MKTQEKKNARKVAESEPEGSKRERERICKRIARMSETLSREKSKGRFCCELSNIIPPLCQF